MQLKSELIVELLIKAYMLKAITKGSAAPNFIHVEGQIKIYGRKLYKKYVKIELSMLIPPLFLLKFLFLIPAVQFE